MIIRLSVTLRPTAKPGSVSVAIHPANSRFGFGVTRKIATIELKKYPAKYRLTARSILQSQRSEKIAPHPAVVATFRGRTVLITGAAGSIGSELARQVAALPIERLLVLDRDENSMFELLRFFEAADPVPAVVPILGDMRDEELVRYTFSTWQPHIVLHAAAYKHVPMMETNPCEAVLNNVTGTRILADAAIGSGAARLLLISTDKAVQSASIMGATKRVAELLLQSRARQATTEGTRDAAVAASTQTVLASVRFVNVLGSRGSVVPIFKEQIAAGGPVTITHEQMTRYFMSIERAARLLLEAATLDDSGSIYALESGDPVPITGLAYQLIEAEGLVPGKDIAIEVTGIRPGEKLQERLNSDTESLAPTVFPGIDRVDSVTAPLLDSSTMQLLESAAHLRDSARVIALLHQLAIDYRQSPV